MKDALLHSSLPAVLSLVPGGHEKVKIRVKVGRRSGSSEISGAVWLGSVSAATCCWPYAV